jgi:hypothetical protein
VRRRRRIVDLDVPAAWEELTDTVVTRREHTLVTNGPIASGIRSTSRAGCLLGVDRRGELASVRVVSCSLSDIIRTDEEEKLLTRLAKATGLP